MKRTTLGSASLLSLAVMVGCMPAATTEEEPYLPGATAGMGGMAGTGGGPGAGGAAAGGGATAGGAVAGGATAGGAGGATAGGATAGGATAGGATAGGATAGGATAGGDGGAADDGGGGAAGGGSAVQAIVGTGANCSTYGLPMNGKCGGIYCGIDEALLTRAFAELPADRACVFPAAIACSGITARTVSSCARSTKSNPFNLGKTNAELRPLIQECVYKEATVKANVIPTCLSCYIDSAECSGDNCLDQCLLGDSAECDKCRLDKGCSIPVAACTGLPNPL